jgi:hypothetical protein
MKKTGIILGIIGFGLAYLYFTSKNGKPRKEFATENPNSGKIIFTETTDTTQNDSTQVDTTQVNLPQPPDINIILPKATN